MATASGVTCTFGSRDVAGISSSTTTSSSNSEVTGTAFGVGGERSEGTASAAAKEPGMRFVRWARRVARWQAPNRLVLFGFLFIVMGAGNLVFDGLRHPVKWEVVFHAAELAAGVALLGLGLRRSRRHGATPIQPWRPWTARRAADHQQKLVIGGPFDTDRDWDS